MIETSQWIVGAETSVSGDRITVLTSTPLPLEPFIRGLVHQCQVTVKHEIPRQEEKNKHQEAEHEDDPGEGHEKAL